MADEPSKNTGDTPDPNSPGGDSEKVDSQAEKKPGDELQASTSAADGQPTSRSAESEPPPSVNDLPPGGVEQPAFHGKPEPQIPVDTPEMQKALLQEEQQAAMGYPESGFQNTQENWVYRSEPDANPPAAEQESERSGSLSEQGRQDSPLSSSQLSETILLPDPLALPDPLLLPEDAETPLDDIDIEANREDESQKEEERMTALLVEIDDIGINDNDDQEPDEEPFTKNTVMVNHAPVAVDDFGTLSEDSIFAVDVVANDTDQNSNDQLTIQPGSVTLLSARDGDGNTISLDTAQIIHKGNRIEFDPGQDFDFLTVGETARVQISYTVQDNAMQSETDDGILSLTITGVKETARAEDVQLDAVDDQSAIVGTFSAVEEFDTNPYHYRVLRQPDEGHVTNNQDGTFNFEPGDDFRDLAEGETRQITFTYEAVDETGAPSAAPATVTLTVTGTNDRPIAEVVNVALISEDSVAVAGQFRAIDADTTDRHSFNILSQPSQGTVINNHDGTFSFAPGTDFEDLSFGETRQVTFTYEAVDDSGTANARSVPATVVLTVMGTNDQPEAKAVAITSAVEDSAAVTGSFSVSDANVLDTHSFTVLTQPLEGQVINNNDGTFSFNPGSDFQELAAGETRQVTFTYAAVDSSGADNAISEPATVTVTVTGTNDRPVANDLSITQGAAVSPSVSGRFSALDWDTSDTVTFNLLNQPSQGAVTNNNDGTFSFDPDGAFDDLASGETRQVTFTYEAVDDSSSANERSEAATVTVIVTGTNDTPVATIDTGAGHEHEILLLNVLANDTDADHNDDASNFSLDVVQVVDNNGDPLAGNGSVRILNNQLEFNPGNDFNHLADGETATVTVRYVMSDDEGASAESTVTITVTGTNDAPVAKADYPISEEGLIPSLASASDQGIQVTSSGEVSGHFAAWKAMDNVDANAVNNSDSWATAGNSGWLQVELPDAHSVMQYSLTSIALTLGREPSEWQLLASNDGVNFVVIDTQTTQTGWASRETRTYTLSEPAEYRYFRLDITDNNGDSYTGIDAFQLYEGTNAESVGTEHEVLTVDVLANDVDPDNNSGSSTFTLNTVETVDDDGNSVTGQGAVTVVNNQLQFDPGSDFDALAVGESAVVTVRYVMSDSGGMTSASTARIVVKGTNDRPVAEPVSVTTAIEDNGSVTGSFSASDLDASDTHTFNLLTSPQDGTVINNHDGTFRFDPGNGFQDLSLGETRQVTFTYEAIDSSGEANAASSIGTVTVTVTGANDGPTAVVDSGQTSENSSVTVDVIGNDSDIDSADILSLKSGSTSIASAVDQQSTAITLSSASVNQVGNSIRFDPGTDFDFLADGEQAIVTVNYQVQDNHGATDQGSLTITVTGSNDGPVALADSGSVSEDNQLLLDVVGNDTDADRNDSLTVERVTIVDNNGDPLTGQGSVSIVNNQLQFSPGSDFSYLASGETTTVSVQYDIADNAGERSQAIATITVTGTNSTPEATADISGGHENEVLMIDVLANDTDIDHSDTPTNFSLNSARVVDGEGNTLSGQGSVSVVNNELRFDPGSDFDVLATGETATVTVHYVMADDEGALSESTVTITVTGTNDAPVARADSPLSEDGFIPVLQSGNEQGYSITASGQLSDNFAAYQAFDQVDASATNNVNSWATQGSSGWLQVELPETTSILQYSMKGIAQTIGREPSEWQLLGSNDGVTFTVIDSRSAVTDWSTRETKQFTLSAPAEFRFFKIDITDNNGDSYTGLDEFQLYEGTNTDSVGTEHDVLTIDVIANDRDPDHNDNAESMVLRNVEIISDSGDPITGQGTATVINNQLQFDPGNDFNALAVGETVTVTVRYVVEDDEGARSESTATIAVTGTNDKPTAEVASISAAEDGAVVTGSFGATDADTTDTHTFNILTQPDEGSVTNNDDGTFSFNPNSDFQDLAAGETRQVTFTYEAVDDSGTANDTSEPATVTITITGTNDKPTAEVASVSATEDGAAVTGSFSATDADTSDTHTFNILTQPDEGSVTNNGDGTFSFNPNSDFQDLAAGETRQVTFTYEAVDGSGTANDTSEQATVTITITGTNDKPTAEVASVSATEDGAAVTGSFSATDADTTDTHTFNILTQPDEGAVTNNGDGTFSFNPNSDFQDLAAGETRQVTFTYEAVDDSSTENDTSQPATVTITITGTNDKPTAEVASVSATEDGAAVTGSFGATDADTTDTHTYNILTQPDEGSVTNNGDGTFSFNPNSDFQDLAAGETRQVTFTYEAVDDSGTANDTSEPATVTITITGTNDKPTAEVASVSATEDGAAVTGSFGATDADTTDTHTFNILTQPDEGSVTNNGDGTFSFNPNSDFQDLAAGETRQVTFTYEAVDDSGTANDTSELATVTITVTGTNDAPVAVADSDTVAINNTLTIDVLANDTDVDSDDSTANFSLDSVSIASISDSDGSRALSGGTVSIENNQLKYVTGSDFDYLAAGETAMVTVTYSMSDDGGLPSTGTAVITVTGSNSQPVAEAVSLDTPVEDGSSISASFRVTDENQSDTHTFNILTQPDEGAVTNNGDGTFSFNPNSDFQDLAAGETRQVTFTYEAVDGSGTDNATSEAGTVTITITGTNDKPTAEVASISATEDGSAVTGSFGATDADTTDTHTFNILTQPDDGTVTNNGDGTFSFNPGNDFQDLAAGETRQVTFTYEAVDDSGTANDTSEPATVTITITGTNDKPTAEVVSISAAEDGAAVTGSFGATDSDTTDTHTFNILTQPDEGTVTNNDDGTFSFNPDNDFQDLAAGETRQVTFTYEAVDDSGTANDTSEPATVTITITGTNDKPTAEVESVSATEDGAAVTGSFGATDADTTDTHTFNILTQPDEGTVTNNDDGTFSFNPDNDFQDLAAGETRQVTFTYEAVDDSGTANDTSEPATVTITITGTNDKPTAEVESISATEDGAAVTGSFGATDADTTDTHTFNILTQPDEGTVTNNDDGTFSFNPDNDFQDLAAGETRQVTFTYEAVDDSGTANDTSEPATVTITITGTNDKPTAEVESISATEDGAAVTGSFGATDADTTDTHTFNILTQPDEGTVTNNDDGTFSFNPGNDFQDLAEGETRQVTFTYEAVDDSGTANDTSEPATVTITVTGTNDVPVAVADTGNASTVGKTRLDVLANDTDADSDDDASNFSLNEVSITGITDSDGSRTINGGSVRVVNNQLEFDPAGDFDYLAIGESATVTVSYTMSDDSGERSTATATITVSGTNSQPVAELVSVDTAVEDGSAVSGSFKVTDANVSDTHTFKILTQPDEGTVTNNDDGTFSFNPGNGFQDLAAGETRQVTFTYEAVDSSGEDNATSASATVTVTVTGTNDKPVADVESVSATEDGAAVTGSFGATDADTTDTHTFNILTQPDDGTVTNNGDGTFSFNPGNDFQDLAAGETRQVTFTYEAVDDSGTANDTSEPATVTITITGTNDKPTAEVVSISAAEDGAAVTGSFGATDSDTTDTHTFNILTQPDEGTVTNNDDGTFSFNPDNDFQDLAAGETRQVTFTYEAVDDSGTANDTSEPATVTITITGTNDKPTAEVENVSATEDGAAVTGSFGATDADTTDTHTFNILTQPDEGTVTNNDDGTFSFNPDNDFQDLAAGETRQVTFTYEAVDDSGTANDTSEPATVTITITGTNDKPTAEVESISATEDGAAVTGSFGATDADTTDTHTFNILTQPDEGTVTNNDDGTFSFNPDNDFQDLAAGETRQVTFTYEAVDDSGTANDTSEPATVTITITGTNDKPTAEVESISATEDGAAVTGSFGATDADTTDTHTFNILTQPDEGTVTNNDDGTFSFNPGNDFQDLAEGETRQVTFTYEAVDDSGTANDTSEPATVTITVTGTNDVPVAVADTGNASTVGKTRLDVLANDTDADSDDDASNFSLNEVSITGITDSDGSRTINGGSVRVVNNQLEFDPAGDFDYLAIGESATVTVSYTMSDDSGERSTATATITVSGTNSQPVAELVSVDTAVEDGSAVP